MSKPRPAFGHCIEYAGWVCLAAGLKVLPRLATVALAVLSGRLMFSVLRVRRAIVMEQLELAFGNEMNNSQIRSIAIRSYQNSVLTFFEFIQPEPLWQNTSPATVEGLDILDSLRGKTALMVSGHLGNWEALGAQIIKWGIPLLPLAKPLHNPLINAAVIKSRRRLGYDILSTDLSMKAVVTMAREGKWLGFLSDQDARRAGIFVDFFGKPASTATGVAYFSYKLNLPILPCFSFREGGPNRQLAFRLLPPIFPQPDASRDQEIERLTEAHVRLLEAEIREHPADYFWLHRRWKTKPKRGRTNEA